jgi:anti-sigma factor RsiW
MFMPEIDEAWTPMPCAQYENQILDLRHGQLTGSARNAVETHLRECLACRAFAEELTALDAALSVRFRRAELPASFKAGLLRRIETEVPRITAQTIASRKQAIESEFQSESAGLLKRVLRERIGSILDGLGVFGVAVVAGVLLYRLFPQDFDLGRLIQSATAQPKVLYAAWAIGAVCVAGAIWTGLQPNLRRLGSAP